LTKGFIYNILLMILPLLGMSQTGTSLSNGDLAIIGMDTGDEDFSFVCFVNINAGTEIYFTDEEADGDYTIGTGEGTVLFTAPVGGVSAGTVITYQGNSSYFSTTSDGNMTLGNSGDGILAYQGSSVGNVTSFLHAVGEDNGDLGSFPGGFSNHMTMGADDGQYSGTRTGTAAALMSAINDNSNWSTSGSGVTPFTTTSFTISGVASGPSITSVSHTPTTPTSSQTVSVSADVTDADGVFGVELHWGTSSGSLGTTISMSNTGVIPMQPLLIFQHNPMAPQFIMRFMPWIITRMIILLPSTTIRLPIPPQQLSFMKMISQTAVLHYGQSRVFRAMPTGLVAQENLK
jgi:hypothetical protein